MSKAAISGASGFVGTHLLKALQKTNIEPLIIERDLLYSPIRLKSYLLEEKPEYIFHLAAYGNHYMQQNIDQIIQANILATTSFLAAANEVKYKAFINVSTSAISLADTTFYSATKESAELIGIAFAEKFNKPVISVRPYSLYGEGEADFRFIPTIIRSCLTKEKFNLVPYSYHDWTYVGDFVKELIFLAKNIQSLDHYIYEVGTGISTSNESIVNYIEQISGKKAHYTEVTTMRSYDSTDWQMERTDHALFCSTKLTEGLEKTYAYYKQKLI